MLDPSRQAAHLVEGMHELHPLIGIRVTRDVEPFADPRDRLLDRPFTHPAILGDLRGGRAGCQRGEYVDLHIRQRTRVRGDTVLGSTRERQVPHHRDDADHRFQILDLVLAQIHPPDRQRRQVATGHARIAVTRQQHDADRRHASSQLLREIEPRRASTEIQIEQRNLHRGATVERCERLPRRPDRVHVQPARSQRITQRHPRELMIVDQQEVGCHGGSIASPVLVCQG